MEVGTGEREGRRRRISERGTDRLSLITGHFKTVELDSSPSSSSSSPHHVHAYSLPSNLHVDLNPEHDASSSLMKHEINDGDSRTSTVDFGSRVEPQMDKSEIDTEVEHKLQPSKDTSRLPNAPKKFVRSSYLNFYTPKEINSCIIASENTRVLCAIVIALLVVLSNTSLPRTIVKSKSIIASRPLYVLLFTDVAIVIARLTLEKRRVSKKAKAAGAGAKDEHNWDGAVRILELGLVVHQTIRAIFIDCSFYAVIVICGLSLL